VTTTLQAELLSVGDLFGEAGAHYEIPIYQRNFAWGVEQIEQLVDDVWAAAQAGADDYFLGNLIVARKTDALGTSSITYEVVDGQQRLTTLFMLLTFLGSEARARLTYQSRRAATDALARLDTSEDEEGAGIHSGFKVIEARMAQFEPAGDDLRLFGAFLHTRVQLVRASLPRRTDLNKYFEVMNTRGQQLEHVDIVKARLMSYLRGDTGPVEVERACFAWIWDACAQMDSYVQMALTPRNPQLRDAIFGPTWDRLAVETFDELAALCPSDSSDSRAGRGASLGLREALDHYARQRTGPDDMQQEGARFESPITFPSLLLHTLKVMDGSRPDDDDGRLDDSRLIKTFDAQLSDLDDRGRAEEARRFAQALLRCRLVLDSFVLKREFTATNGEDGAWSLKHLTRGGTAQKPTPRYVNTFTPDGDDWDDTPLDDATQQVLLLQSMLRVTYTSPRTMHWITGVLRQHLLTQEPAEAARTVQDTLRAYTRQKVHEAFFAGERPTGFGIARIVFTYLDYLLAQGSCPDLAADPTFTFSYRNSIEHFFPQYPDKEQAQWDRVSSYDPELHMLGNLALVSVGSNSKFSNNLPENKVRFRETVQQSAKLQLMAKIVAGGRVWDRGAIQAHDAAMADLLRTDLNQGGLPS
jgi:hypothetical protein